MQCVEFRCSVYSGHVETFEHRKCGMKKYEKCGQNFLFDFASGIPRTHHYATRTMSILYRTYVCKCVLHDSLLLRGAFNAPTHSSATSMKATTSCVVCSAARHNQSATVPAHLRTYAYIHM